MSDTRIWSFGAKAPKPLDYAKEQMFLAHRYRNKLVEIERQRRVDLETILQETFPELATLQGRVDEAAGRLEAARATASAANSAKRKKGVSDPAKALILAIRGELKTLRAELKEMKVACWADPIVQDRLQAVDRVALARGKAARAECGVYWGTYLCIEDSTRSFRKGAPPEFKRYRGDGKIAVQIQQGMSVAEFANGMDTRLQQGERVGNWTTVRFRMGSNPDRSPVWCETRVRFHRQLPADSRIKWAWLLCRRIGTRDKWSFQFVLDGDFGREASASAVFVGVDVGWRMTPDGLRVAYGVDDNWNESELVISNSMLSRWEKVESLQSIRDLNFNEARAHLVKWLATTTGPEWLATTFQALPQWRSPARLAKAAVYWRTNRFDGDAEGFDTLEAWRHQDAHLYNWQAHQLASAVRWRDNLYREFAAKLRGQYGKVRIESMNVSQLQRLRPVEEADAIEFGRQYQRIASVGRLLAILKEAAPCELVPAADTTAKCCGCGQPTGEVLRHLLVHRCRACGLEMDQDRNAAINLLRHGPSSGVVMAQ